MQFSDAAGQVDPDRPEIGIVAKTGKVRRFHNVIDHRKVEKAVFNGRLEAGERLEPLAEQLAGPDGEEKTPECKESGASDRSRW